MRFLALLLFASTLAAQTPPPKQYPHDQVKLFGGQHFNPEITEPVQWTETYDAPSDHFWSRWADKWTLWRITFSPDLLVVPNCLYYDLDAADKVGQIYFPDHALIGKEGITAKVRQGHHIEAHCTAVRPRSQLGVMIARPQDVGLMKCPANTERRTRPNENPALVEVTCVPLRP